MGHTLGEMSPGYRDQLDRVLGYGERTPMATLEDEHTGWIPRAPNHTETQPVPRQSPGPMLHDVYEVVEDGDVYPTNALVLVMEAVEVKARGLAGRKEAIAKATADRDETERYGTFRVVKHGEMSEPITRMQKTEPVDVWT